jgi:hypothetical protein
MQLHRDASSVGWTSWAGAEADPSWATDPHATVWGRTATTTPGGCWQLINLAVSYLLGNVERSGRNRTLQQPVCGLLA